MDQFDLTRAINSERGHRPKPYPRPWPDQDVTRLGKTTRSPEEVRALLAARGPSAAPASRPRDSRGRFIRSA